MSDTDVDNKYTVNSAYIPMTTDKVCIKYNDNPATLAGLKYEAAPRRPAPARPPRE